MVIGVIDIGTNTTRLLVARVTDGNLVPLVERRHFVTPGGRGSGYAGLLEVESAVARGHGAEQIVVAGTAALRGSQIARSVERTCRRLGIGPLEILAGTQEATLAFIGATGTEPAELPDPVAVIDAGGGSTEIAIGTPGGQPAWAASRPVGSRILTERVLLSDPPTDAEIANSRAVASRRLSTLHPPESQLALAVGGASTSLQRICGSSLDPDVLSGAIETVCSAPSAQVAADLELDAARIRVMPAALILLEVVSGLLESPLRLAHGGVREGLVLRRSGAMSAERL